MTNKFEDEDVICLVDADDMLPHKYVLNIIDRTYHDNSGIFSLLLSVEQSSIIMIW